MERGVLIKKYGGEATIDARTLTDTYTLEYV